ncbi:DNA polymerase family A [Saccharopolyspora kobensis]|uniref:DNA-directed DNA polymerase n=1 Tax=Saccharopolyspora kobensis TaxID=146035 RepID=A0A1H6ENT6_9PSEU|nr:DNA polymerase [Saccharopolyspora kobensis]SEG98676.1 DNA polymerase family A [Saccharopolyspora kobensis]SFD23918.1 DNA polymerase I-3'-5' exonuclease and polymerase domains [Saccharopolyspora kobensis]
MQKALFLDIETWGVEHRWNKTPEEFFRLGGYSWGLDGEVVLTEDLEEMRRVIREADVAVAHNGHAFDFSVLFGKHSTEPLELALENRLFDTWTHATLVHPAPSSYVDRNGRAWFVRGPEDAKRWFSLDNQAYQLGVAGKAQDLKALAKRWGGFEKIPTTDPEFREYLVQDVVALRDIARRLSALGSPTDPYAMREQVNAAIDAQNSRNGWRVDVEKAKARIADLEEIKERTLAMLHGRFGLPTEGKAPLRTKAGKEAVLRALAEVGVSEDMLPRTKTGGPSLGGAGLVEVAENLPDRMETPVDGPDQAVGWGASTSIPTDPEKARELAQAIAQIGGLRPLAEQALNYLQDDGRVHPEIFTLQRSGRKSTQNPGLTTWSQRDKKKRVEKEYFVPDSDDHVLVEFDYNAADARIVAAYSGDEAFKERFAPGADSHLITANAVWPGIGYDRSIPEVEETRNVAKALGHAYAYRAGPRTLARSAKQPLEVAQKFVNAMNAAYPKVTKWQERSTKEAQRYGYVMSDWGRRMPVEKDREFTQGPALKGQNGTREIVVDGLIRMARKDIRSIQMLKAQVHDALVFSVPRAELDYWVPFIKGCMETKWAPSDGRGQEIDFPVGGGEPAENWAAAAH